MTIKMFQALSIFSIIIDFSRLYAVNFVPITFKFLHEEKI